MKERHYSAIMRELREDNDYKQKEIAAVLGIDQRVYSRYETAVTAMPFITLLHCVSFMEFLWTISLDYMTKNRVVTKGQYMGV